MSLLEYYMQKLNYDKRPDFLDKYLDLSVLKRLKDISYLCGMDYASKDIYNFKEYISRFDHSVTTSLLTWKCSHDQTMTLAALFHDADTPCFSHVIDYMNKDYIRQESTEQMKDYLLRNDAALNNLLYEDNIKIDDIINFKQYTIVDNERPMLCADRLDGIILSGISWSREVNKKIIDMLIDSIEVYNYKDNLEIGFNNSTAALLAIGINNNINELCHSKEDIYMMELVAKMIKLAIQKGYITYESLYILNEKTLLAILESTNDKEIIDILDIFYYIKKDEIPNIILPKIKVRNIEPLVNNVRIR